ncbi:unnamed protein product [Orchesella dallaii]|uniref:Odorant receptor n=1 Tax=Orchesella dallaii TaxID=48710 RepID=A0ABP1RJK4_9HEXA
MASPLLLKCFSLHQSLIFPYFPHRISWSSPTKQWKFESNVQNLIPFYFIYSLSFLLIYSSSLLVICSALWLHPGLFHAEQIIVAIFVIVVLLLTLVEEVPLVIYGSELIEAINAYIPLDNQLSPQPRNPQKGSLFGEIRKLLRKESFDAAGIILNILIVVEFIVFVPLPIFLVHLDLDPIHLGIIALFPGEYFKWARSIQIPVKIIRHIVTWVGCEIMGRSIRVLIALPLGGLTLFQRVFRKILNQVDLYQGAFQFFMQLHITFAIMNRTLKLIFTMYLSTACICFVVSMVINIKGWGILPPFIYWMSPVTTMFIITILLFVLAFAGDLYSMSEEMLENWKRQLATTSSSGWNRKVARKSLRMCRRIAIPVGDIGVIDKDIKTNYIDNMLNFTIDALVTAEDLLN